MGTTPSWDVTSNGPLGPYAEAGNDIPWTNNQCTDMRVYYIGPYQTIGDVPAAACGTPTHSNLSSCCARTLYFQAFYEDGGGHCCNDAIFDVHVIIAGVDTMLGQVDLNNGGDCGSRYGAIWAFQIPYSTTTVDAYVECSNPYCHGDVVTFRVLSQPSESYECQRSAMPGSGGSGQPGQTVTFDVSTCI